MSTGKTIALTIRTFVGKVMSLLFNTPSRFVIAFHPRSKGLDETASWCNRYIKQYGGSSKKLKIELPYDPEIPLLAYNGQKYNLKRYMHPCVHSSTVHNSQDMETALISINRWVDKEDVVQKYNGILLSHKKEWKNAICSNMNATRGYHTKWS